MSKPARSIAGVVGALVVLAAVWILAREPASPRATGTPWTIGTTPAPSQQPVGEPQLAPPGETRTGDAPKPESVRFVVTAEGDDPHTVADALIDLRFPDSPPFKFTTARDGAASLDVPIATLQGCEARVSAPGFTKITTLLYIDAKGTAALTLTRWPALTGRVLDSQTGKPIAGAQVRAYLQTTSSDIAGEFVMRAEWPDWGAIGEVSAPGHVGVRYEHDPSTGPLTVWLDPGGSVSGTVRTEDGSPVAGADVFCGRDVTEPDLNSLSPSAKSDATGAFLLDGLVLGEALWLSARAKGLPDGVMEGVVATQAAPHVTRDLVLGGGASLTVVAKDPSGNPLADAAVSMGRGEAETSQGRTSGDGSLVIAPLRPGRFTVNVWSEQFGETSADVDVSPDEAKRIELRVPPGIPITGVVVDDEGTPVSGASVAFRAPSPFERRGDCSVTRPSPFLTVRTATDGSFHAVVPKKAGLEYELSAPGHVEPPQRRLGFRERRKWRRSDGELPPVFLPDSEPLRLVLPWAATVRFEVRLPSGARGEFAYVRAFDGAGAKVLDEDLWGASSFEMPVTARRLSIEVDGFLPVIREVQPAACEVLDLGVLAPGRGVAVRGRLVDRDGQPVRGAKLSITREGDDAVWDADARADGSFDVWGIPPGAVEITVKAPGHVRPKHRVAADGRTDRPALTLDRGVAVAVRVVGDAGFAALCDELSVLTADGAPAGPSLDKTTPGLWAGRLPAGRWRLVAKRGETKSELTVDVEGGGPREFAVRLPR